MILQDGSSVRISGAQIPGGRIAVSYLNTGQTVIAANAGDYVYPSDVRLDRRKGLLYVKAHGLGGGFWEETVLFKFNLSTQKLLVSERVESDSLPPECAEASSGRLPGK